MTTAAEDLAPHFAAIAHQLGRIADALEGGNAAGKRPVSRCEATSPQGDYGPVRETEAVRSPHRAAEGHLTVGQLNLTEQATAAETIAQALHAIAATGAYDQASVAPSTLKGAQGVMVEDRWACFNETTKQTLDVVICDGVAAVAAADTPEGAGSWATLGRDQAISLITWLADRLGRLDP